MALTAHLPLVSELEPAWSVEVLRQPNDIAALEETAADLLSAFPRTSGPRFFLASVTPSKWIPRVVVVKSGNSIEGLMFVKERKVSGLPTRMIFGDSTLGTLVVAAPGRGGAVLEQAVHFLVSTLRSQAIRLRVRFGSWEMAAIQQAASALNLDFSSSHAEECHLQIALPATYEDFLRELSVNGRRSMRHRRRVYEAGGHHFVERMDPAEFRRVALRLLDKSVVGATQESVARSLGMLSEVDHPLLCGLRDSRGEWVAILGGWYDTDKAVWLFQMNNDRDYGHVSPATVLRSYFIESLIQKGCQMVFFWAGVGGPAARAAAPYPSVTLCADSRGIRWRAIRGLSRMLAPYLPDAARQAVDWVAPNGE